VARAVSPEPEAQPLRRRLFRWAWRLALGGLVLFLVVGLPYLWWLDRQVQEAFSQLSWQEPTRVFARPLELRSGLRMDARTLELELSAATYRNDGDGVLPGTYARDGLNFVISTRGFVDIDGRVAPQRLRVVLGGGQVQRVADARSGRRLDRARLDPARIATLYGSQQDERRLVRLEDAPPLLITGLQAVEDRNFKHHFGIDPRGILRAMWVNAREGELEQGASTLTQQLVRNDLLLGREQRFARKFKEMLYAILIELRYDKRTILEAYLNQVYMGQRGDQEIRGVGAGAEFWFGKDLRGLRTEEIAMLIGLIKGPSYYDPRRRPERATERRNLVLGVFERNGLISPAERTRAAAAALGVTERRTVARNRYPAFMALVREQLAADYPADALTGAGLTVITTLAPSAQLLSEQAVQQTLQQVQRRDGPELQSGMVVTDTHRGEVLAMVGSRTPDQPGFNRALEAQRPVGSLLKPMVYLLALAQPARWSLATAVDDAPVDITLSNGRVWRPDNSDNRSHGTVTLSRALAQSYNQATVRVGMEVGPDRLSELMKVLGGIRAQPNPSLILGAVDLSPYKMAQLYQFLASGGQLQPLRSVRGVIGADGRAINRYDRELPPAQEGDAIAARLVTLALQQAVSEGTGRALLSDGLGRLSAAGKTGTSNDSRDSWFAGYTGDHLAVVWVGNDANQPTGLYGATGAMRVWSALFARLPSAPLRVSGQGIEWTWLDAQSYATTEENCPGARRYAFVAGYLPSEHRSCAQPGGDWLDWLDFNRPREAAAPAARPSRPLQTASGRDIGDEMGTNSPRSRERDIRAVRDEQNSSRFRSAETDDRPRETVP
jgi:penicillin-binding protein 1B